MTNDKNIFRADEMTDEKLDQVVGGMAYVFDPPICHNPRKGID